MLIFSKPIQMDHIESASRVKKNLAGRKFGENEVEVNYFSERAFEEGELADPVPNTETPETREYKPKREFLDDESDDMQVEDENAGAIANSPGESQDLLAPSLTGHVMPGMTAPPPTSGNAGGLFGMLYGMKG